MSLACQSALHASEGTPKGAYDTPRECYYSVAVLRQARQTQLNRVKWFSCFGLSHAFQSFSVSWLKGAVIYCVFVTPDFRSVLGRLTAGVVKWKRRMERKRKWPYVCMTMSMTMLCPDDGAFGAGWLNFQQRLCPLLRGSVDPAADSGCYL